MKASGTKCSARLNGSMELKIQLKITENFLKKIKSYREFDESLRTEN
jgi:hypothetical protein